MVQASVQRSAVHKRRIVAALDRVGAGIRRRCCECCVGVAVGRRSVRQNPLVEAASAICAVELRRSSGERSAGDACPTSASGFALGLMSGCRAPLRPRAQPVAAGCAALRAGPPEQRGGVRGRKGQAACSPCPRAGGLDAALACKRGGVRIVSFTGCSRMTAVSSGPTPAPAPRRCACRPSPPARACRPWPRARPRRRLRAPGR